MSVRADVRHPTFNHNKHQKILNVNIVHPSYMLAFVVTLLTIINFLLLIMLLLIFTTTFSLSC